MSIVWSRYSCYYLFLLRYCVDFRTSTGPGRGLVFVYREVLGGCAIYEGNGVSNFWTIFPHRACTNYPYGIGEGRLTLEDQLLVYSTDAMNGSVRVPPGIGAQWIRVGC
jgi:hypothetical protein